MKRILFFSHSLELGGAERALIALLHSIDYSVYSVDLFLMRHTGELMAHLPKQVFLLPELVPYTCLAVPMEEALKKGQYGIALGRYIGKKKAASFIKHNHLGENAVPLEYSHKYTKYFMPKVGNSEYDLAISFLTPHYFVAEKVTAKKKVAWIHTDYSRVAVDVASELPMWDRYDRIVAVSDNVATSFCEVFPALKKKVIVIENILSEEWIRDQSTAFPTIDEMPVDGSIRFLSVGRFTYAKNFDNIPDICARIRSFGLNITWYLIGYGREETLIRRKIHEAGMEHHVIILGKKENPYPYISSCDYYVQPSRYEGKSITVQEAQLLDKTVIITDYPTALCQIEDGITGFIVPLENSACAKSISDLLIHQRKLLPLNMNNTQKATITSSPIDMLV